MEEENVKKCCVPFCEIELRKGCKNVKLYPFPKDNFLKRKWLIVIYGKDDMENVTDGSHFVCNRHFTKEPEISKIPSVFWEEDGFCRILSNETFKDERISENNHCEEILSKLNEARKNKKFVDLTVTISNTEFPSHKAILSAVSPFFEELLQQHPETLNVNLSASEKAFSNLLTYIYMGVLKIDVLGIHEIEHLAKILKIQKILDMCNQWRKDNLSISIGDNYSLNIDHGYCKENSTKDVLSASKQIVSKMKKANLVPVRTSERISNRRKARKKLIKTLNKKTLTKSRRKQKKTKNRSISKLKQQLANRALKKKSRVGNLVEKNHVTVDNAQSEATSAENIKNKFEIDESGDTKLPEETNVFNLNEFYICRECGWKTPLYNSMTEHLLLIHKKISLLSLKPFTSEFFEKLNLNRLNRNKTCIPAKKCDVLSKIASNGNGEDKSNINHCCPKCDFISSSKLKLQKHKRGAHKPALHECDVCGKQFSIALNLEKHTKEHLLPVVFGCGHCEHKDVTVSKIRHHFKFCHADCSSLFQCLKCSFQCEESYSFIRHLKNEHNYQYYKKKSLKINENIITELLKDNNDKISLNQLQIPQLFGCNYCSYRAPTSFRIRRHVTQIHKDQKCIFKCLYCDYHNESNVSFLQHQRESHKFILFKRYIAKNECRVVLYDNSESKPSKRLFGCNYCDYSGTTSFGVRRHINTIHKDEHCIFKCLHCEFQHENSSSFLQHQKTNHNYHRRSKYNVFDLEDFKKIDTNNAENSNELQNAHKEDNQFFLHMFGCGHCNYSSSTAFKIRHHTKIAHKNVSCVFKCLICEYRTEESIAFLQHLKYEHNYLSFKTDAASNLNNSSKNASNEENLKLDQKKSDQIFEPPKDLNNINKDNTKVEKFKCARCPKILKSYLAHQKHMLYDHFTMIYQCPYCNYKARKASVTRIHVRRVHNKLECVKCPYCDFIVLSANEVKWHVRRKHQLDPTIYEKGLQPSETETDAEELSKDNDSSKNLSSHTCNICGNYYDKYKSLLAHKRRHFSLKHLYCPYCEFKSLKADEVRSHVVNVHNENPALKCKWCNFCCNDVHMIHEHIVAEHKEEAFPIKDLLETLPKDQDMADKNTECLKCTKCDKEFLEISSFKIHILEHTVAKKFSCPYCAFSTEGIEHIHEHIKLKHNRKTIYKCAACSYENPNFVEFRNHMYSDHQDSFKINVDSSQLPKSGNNISSKNNNIIKKGSEQKKLILSYKTKICKKKLAKPGIIIKPCGFSCTICQHFEMAEEDIKKHIATIHHGFAIYKCNDVEISTPVISDNSSSLLENIHPHVDKNVSASAIFQSMENPHELDSENLDIANSVFESNTENSQADESSVNIFSEDISDLAQSDNSEDINSACNEHSYSEAESIREPYCNMCHGKFDNWEHLKFHSDETGHFSQCTSCEFTTSDKLQLYYHQKNNHNIPLPDFLKGSSYKCSICSHEIHKLSLARNHLRTVHLKHLKVPQNLKETGGNQSNLEFPVLLSFSANDQDNRMGEIEDSEDIVSKEAINEGYWNYICYTCGEFTVDENEMRQHIENIHNKMNSFIVSDSLFLIWKKETSVYLNKDQSKFVCCSCQFTDLDDTSVRQHIKNEHNGMSTYRVLLRDSEYSNQKKNIYSTLCIRCHKEFSSVTERDNHVRIFNHRIFCDKCEYSTKSHQWFYFHRCYKHNIPLPKDLEYESFRCPHCPFISEKLAVEKHIKYTHNNEFQHFCKLCPSRFKALRKLREHLTKHLPEKYKFGCPDCDHRGVSHHAIFKHMQQIHTKDNLKKCPHCSYSGINTSVLNRHLTTHLIPHDPSAKRCRKMQVEYFDQRSAVATILDNNKESISSSFDNNHTIISADDIPVDAVITVVTLENSNNDNFDNIPKLIRMTNNNNEMQLLEDELVEIMETDVANDKTQENEQEDTEIETPSSKNHTSLVQQEIVEIMDTSESDLLKASSTISDEEIVITNPELLKENNLAIDEENITSTEIKQNIHQTVNGVNVTETKTQLPINQIINQEGNLYYVCFACGYYSTIENALTDHIITLHENLAIVAKSKEFQLFTVLPENCDGYICHSCSHTEKSLLDIKNHIKNVHEGVAVYRWQTKQEESAEKINRTHICWTCNSKFFTSLQLRDHVKTSRHRIQCDMCQWSTVGSNYFHLQIHKNLKHHIPLPEDKVHRLYKCPHCVFEHFSEYAAINHVQKCYTHENAFWCTNCHLGFATYRKLLSHLTGHISEGSWFYCSTCSFKNLLSFEVFKHIKSVHCVSEVSLENQESKQITAEITKEKDLYKSQEQLDEASMSSTFKIQKLIPDIVYKCCNCNFNTTNAMSIREHSKTAHDGLSLFERENSSVSIPLECMECKEKFSHENSLHTHMIILNHPAKCNQCSYKTMSMRFLANHQETKHKILTSSINKHHKKRRINKYTRCLCDLCGKTFNNTALLKWHQQSHPFMKEGLAKKNRTHQCPHCKRKCFDELELNTHINHRHRLKLEPEICPICSKICTSRPRLRAHMLKRHKIGIKAHERLQIQCSVQI